MIEVLISGGILMAVILGLASSMNFSQRLAGSVASSNDFNSLVSAIQGLLNNASNCETALGVFNFTSPPSIAGALSPPQTIAPLKTLGSDGAVIAQLGAYGNSLEVRKLEFNYAAPLASASQYLVTLHLEAQRIVGGGAVGTQNLKHDFQLSLTIDPSNSNKIIKCIGVGDSLWKKGANPGDIYYSGGNVGIGTSATPWAPFQIAMPVNTTSIYGIKGTMAIANTDPTPGVINSFHFANSGLFSSAALFTVPSVNTDFGDKLFIQTKQDAATSGGTPGQWNDNQLVLDTNGNVGIGVNTPGSKLQVDGSITPAVNVAYTLGTAALKWADVYSQNAANNTSDIREKKEIQDSDLGLGFIRKLRPVSYRWKNAPDQGLHYGLIAQEAERALREAKGSDELAIVTYDKPADRYGLRYSELISPLIKAVQELHHKLKFLDAKVASSMAETSSKADRIEAESAALRARLEKTKNESAAIKAYLCQKDPSAALCF